MAQAPGFNNIYQTEHPRNFLYQLLIDNDTIVGLGTAYNDSTNWDAGLLLTKFDSNGVLINHSIIIDSTGGSYFIDRTWGNILKTDDGGYIFTATPEGYEYPIVIKTDHDFNVIYKQNYIDSAIIGYATVKLKKTLNGYLLFGAAYYPSTSFDGFIRKIDEAGNTLWLKYYGFVGLDENVLDIEHINDSTYLIATVEGLNTTSARSSLKVIDALGGVLEQWHSEPEPEVGYFRNIITVNDNYIMTYGLSQVQVLPNGTQVLKSAISKFDYNLTPQWTKLYGRKVSLNSELRFFDFDKTLDGNYVATGRISYPIIDFANSTGWLMKFSPDGDSIWWRLDTAILAPALYGNLHSLISSGILSSGSIVSGGTVEKGSEKHIWLIKVTNDGCLDTLYCGLVNALEEGQKANIAVRAFPNPATAYLEVDYSPMQGQAAKLYLSNFLGRWVGVFELDSYSTRHQIPLDGLPNGQYFYSILKDGQRVSTGKFIKLE